MLVIKFQIWYHGINKELFAMIQVADIKPLTDFLRNSKQHIAGLKESGNPELLTVNGEASVVVQDAESYQQLLNLARQTREDARLINALKALRGGEQGVSADEALSKLRNHLTKS